VGVGRRSGPGIWRNGSGRERGEAAILGSPRNSSSLSSHLGRSRRSTPASKGARSRPGPGSPGSPGRRLDRWPLAVGGPRMRSVSDRLTLSSGRQRSPRARIAAAGRLAAAVDRGLSRDEEILNDPRRVPVVSSNVAASRRSFGRTRIARRALSYRRGSSLGPWRPRISGA